MSIIWIDSSRFAAPAATDPYFSSVILLLNGGALIDSSPAARTVTANGATPPSIAGDGSILFPNLSGSNLTVPSSADFALGTGDFTLEVFLRQTPKDLASLMEIGNHQNSAGIVFLTASSGGGALYSSRFYGSVFAPTANVLIYMAWVRQAGVLSTYKNTNRMGTASFTNNLTSTGPVSIGSVNPATNTGYLLNGNVTGLRLTKSVARLSGATAVVPPFPFPTS